MSLDDQKVKSQLKVVFKDMMPSLVWNQNAATTDHYEHYLELNSKNFKNHSNDQKIVRGAGYTVFDLVNKETIAEKKVDLHDPRCGDILFWLVAATHEGKIFSFPEVQVGAWTVHDIQWKSQTKMLSFKVQHPFP